VEHPRTDTHAPDFGARVLSEEALRRSEGVVINDIRTTVNVYGHNFPPVGLLDLRTDVTLVYGIAASGSLLSRIAGLAGGHRVSPHGNVGHLERIIQIRGKVCWTMPSSLLMSVIIVVPYAASLLLLLKVSFCTFLFYKTLPNTGGLAIY
jgi:hypothetical protein